jgi:3-oxoadipate enol-lactonase
MSERTTADGVIAFTEDGQGPPLVLLHAFPLGRAMWKPQVAAFSGDHRVLALDLRGFGGSRPFDGPPSVDQLADDVAALLDDRGVVQPAIVGGLSMGGYAALAFARRHPGRLRALILADTRAEADTPEAKANRDQLIAFASSNPPAAVLEQMLPRLLGARTRAERPAVAEEARRLAAAQTPAGIVGALQALRDRPDAGPYLARVAVPTLVLVGDEDVLTPPDAARSLAGRIPGSHLEVIPGAGHLSNLEQPGAFNALVRQFLEQLSWH